ncbi:hypothetical protein [Longimicrobium terrae]|uniref:Uncharacterized protein n=1 Tax=Longimicrobium terrae TaxID=1639882 RepID=A0A841H085_9BACT|nr:hypothetical protein [Longimicrobium terrae]MBB4636927.1 hypothetical protein [Longimicrobium terrae]MBB6071465.1 hypothetical protein [Longimicrobium terrae]NNC31318.1 hypothetical protein [Longimicrobium terrae]
MTNDLELMLWALSHGWRVALFREDEAGALWRSPTGPRFLVTTPDLASDLPALSPELRGILTAERIRAATAAGSPG